MDVVNHGLASEQGEAIVDEGAQRTARACGIANLCPLLHPVTIANAVAGDAVDNITAPGDASHFPFFDFL